MKLYYSPGARSLPPRLALREAGLAPATNLAPANFWPTIPEDARKN